MSTVIVGILGYTVFFYGGPNGNSGVAAYIGLQIEGYGFVSLHFYPSGATIPANSERLHASGQPMFDAHFRYEQFANILDVLRNEKPIRFFFRRDNLMAYLTTATELVGEGE